MYEGTVRMLMEYGATTMEHLELLNKRESCSKFLQCSNWIQFAKASLGVSFLLTEGISAHLAPSRPGFS